MLPVLIDGMLEFTGKDTTLGEDSPTGESSEVGLELDGVPDVLLDEEPDRLIHIHIIQDKKRKKHNIGFDTTRQS